MFLKIDCDATLFWASGHCVASLLPIVYGHLLVIQLEEWFNKSLVPESVFSAGAGLTSLEAWYTTALEIQESLSVVGDSHVHVFVVGVVKSFDTVGRRILDRVLSSLGLPDWFRLILSIMLMSGCVLSWMLALVNLGSGVEEFHRDVR